MTVVIGQAWTPPTPVAAAVAASRRQPPLAAGPSQPRAATAPERAAARVRAARAARRSCDSTRAGRARPRARTALSGRPQARVHVRTAAETACEAGWRGLEARTSCARDMCARSANIAIGSRGTR